MGKGGGGVTGFRYSLGIFMGVCMGPINALLQIKVGNVIAWTGNVTSSGSFNINQPGLFGGDQKEGGINGELQVFMGESTQILANNVKASLLGGGLTGIPDDSNGLVANLVDGVLVDPIIIPASAGPVPGFRGVLTMFFRGEVTANTPYPKPWKMRVRRTTQGWDGDCWYPEMAQIPLNSDQGPGGPDIIAMNPAHIIYECATNGLWGRGLDRSKMDDQAFRGAALQLFNEGLGLCLRWTRQETLASFVQTVINHIGAVTYIDRSTGLFALALIRGGYDPTTLPVFDANSGLLSVVQDAAASQDTSTNEVIVNYSDPIQDVARQARAQSIAAIQSAGGAIVSTTTDYPGIPTPDLAARIALRDLTVSINAVKRFVVKLDRRGWGVQMGSVIRISDPQRGVVSLILRVGQIDDSTSGDGSITITGVEDIFSLPDEGFTGSQPRLWQPPNNVPAIPPRQAFSEVTYRDLVRRLTPADLAQVGDTAGAVMVLASRPNLTSTTYQLWTQTASEAYVDRATGGWCPSARLPTTLTPLQTTVTVDKPSEWSRVALGTGVLIGDEWLRLDAFDVTTGIATLGRGCVDTIPQVHPPSYVFFADVAEVSDQREYSSGEVVTAKVLTVTSSAVLDITLAPVNSVTIVRRHFRPYPPGNVLLNGVSIYTPALPATAAADQVITWAHRDRLTQLDSLVSHATGSVGPEPGTTYTVRVYSFGGTLLRTEAGIAAATWTYTTAMQAANGSPRRARIELEAVRDGLVSFQKYSFLIGLIASGWGFTWGFDWNGPGGFGFAWGLGWRE